MSTLQQRIAAVVACAALAAAALIGPALAQPANEDAVKKAFAEADANGDGVLDLDEFVGNTIFVFRQVDVNRDGTITLQEAIAFSPHATEKWFRATDRNNDGKLSVGEAAAGKVLEFFEIDTNRDGTITLEEVLVYQRKLNAAR